jgi:hypothetical protein
MPPPTPSRELVEWLEDKYRDRCPKLSDTDREVWVKVGEANVVRKLRSLLDKPNQTVLGDR